MLCKSLFWIGHHPFLQGRKVATAEYFQHLQFLFQISSNSGRLFLCYPPTNLKHWLIFKASPSAEYFQHNISSQHLVHDLFIFCLVVNWLQQHGNGKEVRWTGRHFKSLVQTKMNFLPCRLTPCNIPRFYEILSYSPFCMLHPAVTGHKHRVI